LANIACEQDMGEKFADSVYQRELDYLIEHEYVKNAEDLLWRRTKLGLYLDAQAQAKVAEYIDAKHPQEKVLSLSKVS
jgi:glycerol-3-phosphate dehydrogenase